MKERTDAKAVARKTFKVVKTGLGAILGATIGGIVGLVHGMAIGVAAGIKGDFASAVTVVLSK